MDDVPNQIVLPSEIPWDSLTGQALEELLFWLCDAQGARDVQWRTGAGGPSADGGRDVEATFASVDEDGELHDALWWLQAKGRSRTVEPMAVKEAAVTAAGFIDVDVVVVATNSAFSNPTRDWVAKWNNGHDRPHVLLWDQHALERMLVRHPSVIARIAPQALSPSGQAQAIAARFYRSTRLAARHELAQLWEHVDELELTERQIIALVCAELEHGSVIERPWMLGLDEEDCLYVCAYGLMDLMTLLHRALTLGVDVDPLRNLAEHLIAVSMASLPADIVRMLVDNPWQFFEGEDTAPEALVAYREMVIAVPLARFRQRFGHRCAQDCRRMYAGELADETPADLLDTLLGEQQLGDARTFQIEKLSAECPVGLELNEERTCPWFREAPFAEVIEELQVALRTRVRDRSEEHVKAE